MPKKPKSNNNVYTLLILVLYLFLYGGLNGKDECQILNIKYLELYR